MNFYKSASLAHPLMQRLGVLAACTVLANVFSLLAVVMLARAMGTANFGVYYLLVSGVNIFVVPIALGLGASIVHQIASGELPGRVLGAAAIYAVGYLLILCTVYEVIVSQTNILLVNGLQNFSLNLAGFAVATIFGLLVDAYLRGLKKTKVLGLLRLCTGFLNIIVAALIIIMGNVGPEAPLTTRTVELTAFIVLSLYWIRGINFPNLKMMKDVFKYALPASISVIGLAIFVGSDKFIIASLLDLSEAGRYSIAFFLSYTLVSRGVDIVLAIFFPEAVANKNKADMASRLNQMTPKILLFFTPLVFSVMWLVTKFLGDAFMIGLWRSFFFSLGGMLFFIAHLHWWMISSVGSRGVTFFALFSLLASVLVVALNLVLVTKFGLDGALFSLLAGTLFLYISGNMTLWKISKGKWLP